MNAGAPLLLLALASVQEPTQPPVFGTGVDVVAVDVSVVDGQGRPLSSLQPADFSLSVDGQPRRLVSAEFLALGREPEDSQPLPAGHYSTNAGLALGRLVLFAVDQDALPPGEGRLVLQSAAALVDRLTPADRVALLAFPGPGPRVDFTGDRAKVKDALARIVGRAGVVQRQLSTAALRGLLRSLRLIEAPKNLVLISAGAWNESPEVLRELAELAAEARVSLFALQVESAPADAARAAPLPRADLQGEVLGLQALAAQSRGAGFKVNGTGQAVFERIARELQGYYLLGFAPEPADRDGRSHEIRVSVSRSGCSVRARGRLRIPALGGPDPGQNAQSLQALLGAPYLTSGLPLRVASFARPLPGPAGERARVLIAVDVGRPGENLRGVSLAYRVIDSKGQVVRSEMRALEGQAGPGPVAFRTEVELPSGLYTLRLAGVDAQDRHGSVEHALKAAPIQAGPLSLSDLMLSIVEPGPDSLLPAVDLECSSGPFAFVELLGERPEAWRDAQLGFEIAASESGPALASAAASWLEAGPGRRLGSARLGAESLPAGEYWVRAVVSVAGKPVAQSARPFRRL